MIRGVTPIHLVVVNSVEPGVLGLDFETSATRENRVTGVVKSASGVVS